MDKLTTSLLVVALACVCLPMLCRVIAYVVAKAVFRAKDAYEQEKKGNR